MDEKTQSYQMQMQLHLQHQQQQQQQQLYQTTQSQYHQHFINQTTNHHHHTLQHSPPQLSTQRTSPPSYNAASHSTNPQATYYQYQSQQSTTANPTLNQAAIENYPYQLNSHHNNYVNYTPVQIDPAPSTNTQHYIYPNSNQYAAYLNNQSTAYQNYFAQNSNKTTTPAIYDSSSSSEQYNNYHHHHHHHHHQQHDHQDQQQQSQLQIQQYQEQHKKYQQQLQEYQKQQEQLLQYQKQQEQLQQYQKQQEQLLQYQYQQQLEQQQYQYQQQQPEQEQQQQLEHTQIQQQQQYQYQQDQQSIQPHIHHHQPLQSQPVAAPSPSQSIIQPIQAQIPKKVSTQSMKPVNTLNSIDPTELKQLIKTLSRENETNEDSTKLVNLKSSLIPISVLPKYVKPKLCKSPIVIHVVNSKQVHKPQAQLSIVPEQKALNYPIISSTSNVSLSNQRQLISKNANTTLPAPPRQRPISPPNVPPQIHRNSAFTQFNQSKIQDSSQISFTPRSINNSLLNSVLNNSLNMSADRKAGIDYESSFNGSLNLLNSSAPSNYSINNNNNTNTMTNFHAMLYSPNLMTLFDRKKEPPPPYPGKTALSNDDDDDMDQGQGPNRKSSSNSAVRYCSPWTFKFFMEQHVENILKHHKAREFRRFQLESELSKLDLDSGIKDMMRKLLRQKETNYLRLRRTKMNKNMFEHIKVLGVGAFGEVNLVRKKDESEALYAMKILHKSDVFNRNQAAHVKAERDILAEADSEWVVKLYYSFQDEENLYFIMDYVPGGDLMNLLIKMQVFSEPLAKFYIGELTCAIESVHHLGFIHRDIKPDNILIDKNGHIKLTDFGLCTGFHWTHSSSNYRIG